MAVTTAMFLFEVMVENVRSLVESRNLVIKSDFADIFSLELKDPKQMHIVMPEPLPLPPEPAGKKKKGKKKKPPKPKKGKKGKKGKVEAPPPEPAIQSGQSVLFTSSAEFLTQNMKKFPMEVSLWSKEDNLVFIGMTLIPWDQVFYTYLEQVFNCKQPPPANLKEEYNIFEEGTAKMMAKMGIQIKLTYLTDKVTTAFRTLSEDPNVRKCLYTGANNKQTSFMCTLKTTDDEYRENYNKIRNQYIVDKPKSNKVVYATYKNAPGANLTFFNDGDYCCMKHADKPPESKYKAPECCPDIDFIIDYVRKTIVSCNDNMRMITPRPTIKPRVKATDIDRLCYCKETAWPPGPFVERFKNEMQSEPCPLCIEPAKKATGNHGATFDIANIRGPCGKVECRIAKDMRAYIENLVNEDNVEFNVQDIIGPCGSKDCTVAERIQQFLRHEGMFVGGENLEGMSTQCACVQKMQEALTKRQSCESVCSKECEDTDSEASHCKGKGCPYPQKVYNVYYFTVEYDFDKGSDGKSGGTTAPPSEKSSKYKFCSTDSCPSAKASEKASCSKSICSSQPQKTDDTNDKCQLPVCPVQHAVFPPSPADSNVVIGFEDIHRPCCVKSCDVAEKVKDFIVDGVMSKKDTKSEGGDPCYCDCVCTFKFSNKTTYCGVCGGYECLGDDVKDQPAFMQPHPCPIYHKLYDKTFLKTPNPWPEEEPKPEPPASSKSSKAAAKTGASSSERRPSRTKTVAKDGNEKKGASESKVKKHKSKEEKKTVGKFTAVVPEQPPPPVEKKPATKPTRPYPYPPVPKNMGWNWTAEDIPGLKFRPKWRPGAANKILVRRYRALLSGVDIIGKKKRALLQRKKKAEMKPTIIVSKKDGEFLVQMEVFKKYSKERLLFQYPYEEKPPIIYTIGKTQEEKLKIKKQRERRERRETRRKSRLLQSTFKDKCQEICLKAYNQAIGLLPLPNPNNPNCPCQTQSAHSSSQPVDSCSCSEEGSISSDDTDHDEWTVQFSPPAALWDSRAKHPPVLVEDESQYTYLDYKVKLLDKAGNPIPRYFKGPDGKQECSDLGGFWSPTHTWLEINKDGFIGADNRWVPTNFLGPDGLHYFSEDGVFTDSSGQVWKLGIDGYIDKDGKWGWYSKGRSKRSPSAMTVNAAKKSVKGGKRTPAAAAAAKGKSGRASTPKGKKPEKKLSPILSPKGGKVSPKKIVSLSSGKARNPLVMSLSMNYMRNKSPRLSPVDNMKPIDPKKLAKYREIMDDLQMYADIGDLKVPAKTNRASNTPRKKVSPFTMHGPFGTDRGQSLAVVKSFANRTSISSQSESPSPDTR